MRRTATIIAAGLAASGLAIAAERTGSIAQQGIRSQTQGRVNLQQANPNAPDPVIVELVNRYTLDNFKSTLKGLTQFGDRRQGTQRNRDAVQWIAAQLKS